MERPKVIAAEDLGLLQATWRDVPRLVWWSLRSVFTRPRTRIIAWCFVGVFALEAIVYELTWPGSSLLLLPALLVFIVGGTGLSILARITGMDRRVYLSPQRNATLTIHSGFDGPLPAYRLSNHIVAKVGQRQGQAMRKILFAHLPRVLAANPDLRLFIRAQNQTVAAKYLEEFAAAGLPVDYQPRTGLLRRPVIRYPAVEQSRQHEDESTSSKPAPQ